MESNIKQRNPVYDCAKGLGILFVVMGHCYALGYQFYTKFHVLFFFVFSGLMLKSDSINSLKALWQNLCKFWKRYALPYIICNSIFLIFYNLFVKYHLVTNDYRYSMGVSIISLDIFLRKLVNIFFLLSSSELLCGATWFLRSLFWGLLSVAILLFITSKYNKNAVYIITSTILIALTILIENKFLLLYSQSILCLILGDCLKDYTNKITSCNIYSFCISVMILFLSIYFVKIQILTIILCAIFGFIFILQSCMLIEKYFTNIYNILVYIGQKTLPILCLHMLFFKFVTYFYIIHTNSNILLLGTFPSIKSIHHPIILSLAYIMIGILMPIICYQIYMQLKKMLIGIINRRYA